MLCPIAAPTSYYYDGALTDFTSSSRDRDTYWLYCRLELPLELSFISMFLSPAPPLATSKLGSLTGLVALGAASYFFGGSCETTLAMACC